MKFFKRMLYSIGYIGSDPDLRLHLNLRRRCPLGYLFQDTMARNLILLHIVIIINNAESHESAIELRVTHHHSKVNKTIGIFRIFHRDENTFIILYHATFSRHIALLYYSLLRSLLRNHSRDNASKQYHQRYCVQQIIIHYWLTAGHNHLSAHHHNSNSTGSMSRCQAKHHITRNIRHLEKSPRYISSSSFSRSEEHTSELQSPDH